MKIGNFTGIMGYKKFRADQLFDGYQMREDQPVLITTEDGTIENIVSAAEAGDDIQQLSGILSPGFINCHCHLELSHMKGKIGKGTGLVDFVWQVVTQRHFQDEEILKAIAAAEDEMLTNGIVAAGDLCNNALTIPQKLKGRIWYHNFIEASGFSPQVVEERFKRSAGFFSAYAQLYSIPVESNSIVPHAAYSVAEELWKKIIHFPGNHVMTIHNQESPAEDELFLHGRGEFLKLYEKMGIDISFFKPSGKSSLQTYLPKFLPNQSVILVHNVHTSEEDILFSRQWAMGSQQSAVGSGLSAVSSPLAAEGLPKAAAVGSGLSVSNQLYWCLCPNANLYIGGQLPDIDLLMKHDCTIVLGTDSLASNHQLSILEEMKTIQQHLPHISTTTMLRWATGNGAKALQVDELLGSFDVSTGPGRRKPGILLIKNDLSALERLA